jgi:nucleotide-binding universal stress UspA family protein
MARLFRRILVPHDFSKPATYALRVAADLARAHRGRLTVLHVVAPFSAVTPFPAMEGPAYIPPVDIKAERKRLEALVRRTLGDRPPVRVGCDAVVGDPHRQIVEAGRRHDSIVMATEGRTGLSHLLIGSVAEKVVRHATVPVVTVRPRAGRTARRAGARRSRWQRRAARRVR